MERTNAVRKPLGGFVFLTVWQVCRLWIALQHRRIRTVDVRVWLAAHEVVARRCQVKTGQQCRYRVEELDRLVGSARSILQSLRRLTQAGLLRWDEAQITFPEEATSMGELQAVTTMLEQIRNHQRRIPVPRRILRYLAGGGSRVQIGTMFGHLLSCLYYRHGLCCPDGHCKATWIAKVFGLSLRRVKHIRHELEALGVLQRHDAPQWVLNRYGVDLTINLQWDGPPHDGEHVEPSTVTSAEAPAAVAISAPQRTDEPPATVTVCDRKSEQPPVIPTAVLESRCAAAEIAPLASAKRTEIAPPDSYAELSTREEHQKPAARGGAGVLSSMFLEFRTGIQTGVITECEQAAVLNLSDPAIRNGKRASRGEHQTVAASVTPTTQTAVIASLPAETETHPKAPSKSLSPPTLRHILLQDLRDTERLLQLYTQAVNAKLLSGSEADRLNFVALAQHVLSYRPDNPGGLFTQLLRKRQFDYITQDDEDAAQRRLKRVLYEGTAKTLGDAVSVGTKDVA